MPAEFRHLPAVLCSLLLMVACTCNVGDTNYASIECVDCELPLTHEAALALDGKDGMTIESRTEVISDNEIEKAKAEAKAETANNQGDKKRRRSSYSGACHSHPICVITLVPATLELLLYGAVGVATGIDKLVDVRTTWHHIQANVDGKVSFTGRYTRSGQLITAQTFKDDEIHTFIRSPLPCIPDKAEVRRTSVTKGDGTVEVFDPRLFHLDTLRERLSNSDDPKQIKCVVTHWMRLLTVLKPNGEDAPNALSLVEFAERMRPMANERRSTLIQAMCPPPAAALTADVLLKKANITPQSKDKAAARLLKDAQWLGDHTFCDRILEEFGKQLSDKDRYALLIHEKTFRSDIATAKWSYDLLEQELAFQCTESSVPDALLEAFIRTDYRVPPIQSAIKQTLETCKNLPLKKRLQALLRPSLANGVGSDWIDETFDSDDPSSAIRVLAEAGDTAKLLTLIKLSDPVLSALAIDAFFFAVAADPKAMPRTGNTVQEWKNTLQSVPAQTVIEALFDALQATFRHPDDAVKLLTLLHGFAHASPKFDRLLRTKLLDVSKNETELNSSLTALKALLGDINARDELLTNLRKDPLHFMGRAHCASDAVGTLFSIGKKTADAFIGKSNKRLAKKQKACLAKAARRKHCKGVGFGLYPPWTWSPHDDHSASTGLKAPQLSQGMMWELYCVEEARRVKKARSGLEVKASAPVPNWGTVHVDSDLRLWALLYYGCDSRQLVPCKDKPMSPKLRIRHTFLRY